MTLVMNDAVLELIETGLKKLEAEGLLKLDTEMSIKEITREYFGMMNVDIIVQVKGAKQEKEKESRAKKQKTTEPRPKRGKSSWDIYLAEKRAEFKEYLSDDENKEELEELGCKSLSAAILKYAGKKWKEVTDKSYYEAESEKSKEAVAAENLAAGFSPKKGKKSPKSPKSEEKVVESPKKVITPKKLIQLEENEEHEEVEAIEVIVDKKTYYYDEENKTFYDEDSEEIKDKKLVAKLKKAVKELQYANALGLQVSRE